MQGEDWRLREAQDSDVFVVNDLPSQSAARNGTVPNWFKVAAGVTSAVTIAGWFIAGQEFANQFNDNRAITLGSCLAAGVLGKVAQKIILPASLDQKIYHYTARYDHVIFQSLSLIQQALPQTLPQRQIWFPAIFFHAGYVISGYIIFKSGETKGNQPEFQGFIEERRLLEGDTVGSREGLFKSLKPFIFKTGVLAVSGVAMAVIGRTVANSFTVWRLGWVTGGIGMGMIPAQQMIMQLNRHRENYLRTLTSSMGSSARSLLALAVSLMPAVGNVGVCTALAVSINAPSAALRMDFVAAVVNLSAGVAISFLDVASQDRFQHPKSVSDRNAAQKPIWTRCWEDIKRRPGDYVAMGASLGLEGAFIAANVIDPSPGSTMDASIILITTAATLAFSYLVEATCTPSENSLLNQVNFLFTRRSIHIINSVYLIFLTNYFLDRLSAGEFTTMWVIYGVLMGLFLKPNFDENPDDWAAPSTTFLAEVGVTGSGFVQSKL